MTSEPLAHAFRDGLPVEARSGFAASAKLDDALAVLHARGVMGWPTVTLRADHFATEVARRLGATATPEALAELHHDLYLAVAAHRGDPDAASEVHALCERAVAFAAARLRASPTEADDARSELRRLVFTQDQDRPAAIGAFAGRGDLLGYLRIIVARTLGRSLQRAAKQASLDDELADELAARFDPETALMREHYRPEVDAALRAAVAALPDRGRAVLRYSLIDGWSIDQLGACYGVHRATAARWLAATREELGRRIREHLGARLAITDSQVDSIVTMVASGIEVSLARMLAD